MKTHVRTAALTLTVLTALSGAGILVHRSAADPRQDGDVTPRTVVQAEPALPCPFPYPLAVCAPEPPAPLPAMGTVSEESIATADAYTRAWEEAGL